MALCKVQSGFLLGLESSQYVKVKRGPNKT